MKKLNVETVCVQGFCNAAVPDKSGSVAVPIYQTATFAHPAVGESTGYDYSRVQNPTREEVENRIRELEGGEDALAFSSGMAAVACVMECFQPGDEILAGEDLYGGSIRLFQHISKKNGLQISFVNTSDIEAIEKSIHPNTKAIFMETPSNPMMNITDIKAVAKLAEKCRISLIVDNTFLTPYFQTPIALGADIVIHSGTKYLGGHNDTLAGFVVTADKEWGKKMRFVSKTTGAVLAPMDSWLILRGIKTLALRMERQTSNALAIAEWLKEQKAVKQVYYIGLKEHPGYEIHKKQSKGAGAMISFRVDKKDTAICILEKIKLIQYAESLGGVESLMTYPMLQTHADIPKVERERKGIDETLLRLSVGIEHYMDIIEDLRQAFEYKN